MSLKTRLDGRSADNKSFQILDEAGKVVATVELLDSTSVTLDIKTEFGKYIQKPNGWRSK